MHLQEAREQRELKLWEKQKAAQIQSERLKEQEALLKKRLQHASSLALELKVLRAEATKMGDEVTKKLTEDTERTLKMKYDSEQLLLEEIQKAKLTGDEERKKREAAEKAEAAATAAFQEAKNRELFASNAESEAKSRAARADIELAGVKTAAENEKKLLEAEIEAHKTELKAAREAADKAKQQSDKLAVESKRLASEADAAKEQLKEVEKKIEADKAKQQEHKQQQESFVKLLETPASQRSESTLHPSTSSAAAASSGAGSGAVVTEGKDTTPQVRPPSKWIMGVPELEFGFHGFDGTNADQRLFRFDENNTAQQAVGKERLDECYPPELMTLTVC